jgi:hypothetical protein
MQTQAAASSRRLFTAIKNFEDYLLLPVLLKISRMLESQEADIPEVAGRGAEGQGVAVPGSALAAPVSFKMRGSTKAQARTRLAGALQVMLQYLFNPALVGMAQKQQKVLDFNEVDRFVNEALGTAQRYAFWRSASPQEMQAMSQPDPDTQAQIQDKEADRKVRTDIATIKAETDLQKEGIRSTTEMQLKAEDVAMAVIEMLRADKNVIAGLLTEGKEGGSKREPAGEKKQSKK